MDSVVRGGNWYFDDLNAWRILDEVNLPEIKFKTEDFSPGGHVMGVDFPEGLETLKATIKVKTDDPRLRGLCGRQPGNYITCTWYENLVSYRTGQNVGRVITLKGLINSVKPDGRKQLNAAMTEYEFSTIVLYDDIVDQRNIHRFDFFGGPARRSLMVSIPSPPWSTIWRSPEARHCDQQAFKTP